MILWWFLPENHLKSLSSDFWSVLYHFHSNILVKSWWRNNLTQITKNYFVKNILKKAAFGPSSKIVNWLILHWPVTWYSVSWYVGMGRYWYRYRQYRHIGTFFSIGSIGIGNKKRLPNVSFPESVVSAISEYRQSKYRHIGVSAKMWYRPIPTGMPLYGHNYFW